jgi:Domain of unknown function (DUF4158)
MIDDSVEPSEIRQRLGSGICFPTDLTLEELIRGWILSETDPKQVRICRGEDPSRRFALQLCTVRRYGRFLETDDDPPLQIVNYREAQLQLPPVLLVAHLVRIRRASIGLTSVLILASGNWMPPLAKDWHSGSRSKWQPARCRT